MEAVMDRREAATSELGTQRRAVSVPEASTMLGISVTTGWKMAYNGQMRVVRFGRAVRVPIDEVERLLSGTPAEGVDVTAR